MFNVRLVLFPYSCLGLTLLEGLGVHLETLERAEQSKKDGSKLCEAKYGEMRVAWPERHIYVPENDSLGTA